METDKCRQAVQITEEIMRTYYCKRDIYAVLDYLAPDATWIGPGEREKKYKLDEIREYFEMGKDAIPSCNISDVDLRAVDLGDNICLVTGSLTICTIPGSELVVEVDQRVSFTFRFVDGKFRVIHMHISNPYGEMKKEEYFPHEVGAQSYQYLQRLLKEKTDVIDMIVGNITGGLKGSNDDSTYSYFYVNEELPRMLDLTYDQFMERTGGTAVGAVYPPDLPAALEDCARCFAKGPVYSTEYRMEKKDGTLIWVLDSGRKVTDAEGVTRINSMVTDITPIKQALFDLELERERYRIALKNIIGTMCEYDMDKDLFILYRQKDNNIEQEVEKREFFDFTQKVLSGKLVHPEDGEAFLDLCNGRNSGFIEVRTRLFDTEDTWQWNQFNCSVITDSTGAAIRSLGILKDITEEKARRLKLLNQLQRDGLTQLFNQTAVKEVIQTYLEEKHEGKVALLMVDLDRFKEVNDSNGHLYGNDVLIKMARILVDVAGENAIVGRAGGDEFIVLIKDKEVKEVTQLAEEIVKRVNKIGEEISFFISCSIGISTQVDEKDGFLQLFERADKALYRAKERGRNQWAMEE